MKDLKAITKYYILHQDNRWREVTSAEYDRQKRPQDIDRYEYGYAYGRKILRVYLQQEG